jgi:hypothetical protein
VVGERAFLKDSNGFPRRSQRIQQQVPKEQPRAPSSGPDASGSSFDIKIIHGRVMMLSSLLMHILSFHIKVQNMLHIPTRASKRAASGCLGDEGRA